MLFRSWGELAPHFEMLPGTRQIFEFDVDSVQTSCGWGVPLMTFDRESQTLKKYAAKYTKAELLAYQRNRTKSIDGLPIRLQDHVPG